MVSVIRPFATEANLLVETKHRNDSSVSPTVSSFSGNGTSIEVTFVSTVTVFFVVPPAKSAFSARVYNRKRVKKRSNYMLGV